MNIELLAILFINLVLLIIGVLIFNNKRDISLERDKLALERERLEFEKYKFDEMETNKYTYLLYKAKLDKEIFTVNDLFRNKALEANINNKQVIHNDDIAIKRLDVMRSNDINYERDVVVPFDGIIKSTVETHLFLNVFGGNSADTAKAEDIKLPVGTEFEKQYSTLKSSILDSLSTEVIDTFNRYMRRDKWEDLLAVMLRVYFKKSINLVRLRKEQLATIDNATTVKSDGRRVLFMNGVVNPNAGLTPEQEAVIKYLNLKSIKELETCINTLNGDSGERYETQYGALKSINLALYK